MRSDRSAIFIVYLLVACQAVFGSPCSDRLVIQPTKWEDLGFVARLRERIPLYVARLGRPSYSETRFNVRVVGKGRPDFSPTELQAGATQMAAGILNKYGELGLHQKSFIQIILEAKPGTIKTLTVNENDKLVVAADTNHTPWVGNAREFIFLPRLFRYELFTGLMDMGDYPEMPLFMVFPARDNQNHWFGDPFLMAHEIAHIFENPKSHKSLVWREARADALAYVSTGIHKLEPAGGYTMQVLDSETAEARMEHIRIARDLSNPRIATRSQAAPSIGAYHQNSEIISSFLFAVKAQLGEAVVADLIKWMDADTDSPVPQIKPLDPEEEQRPGYLYIDPTNLEASRTAVLDELDSIVGRIRQWAKRLPEAQADAIESILVAKGFQRRS